MSHKRRDRSSRPSTPVPCRCSRAGHRQSPIFPCPGSLSGLGRAPLDSLELVAGPLPRGISGVITSVRDPGLGGQHRAGSLTARVRVALAVHPSEAVLHAGVREVGPDGLDPDIRPHHAEPAQ